MKNKLLFRLVRFFKSLGIKPEDITLDLENEAAMAQLAQTLFGAVLNLPELEDEYYGILQELYGCTPEEAEEKEIFEVVHFIIKQLKSSAAFSFGALTKVK